MSARLTRVARLLQVMTPYRHKPGAIRRVLSVVPNTRPRYRATQDKALAAIIALPHRVDGGIQE